MILLQVADDQLLRACLDAVQPSGQGFVSCSDFAEFLERLPEMFSGPVANLHGVIDELRRAVVRSFGSMPDQAYIWSARKHVIADHDVGRYMMTQADVGSLCHHLNIPLPPSEMLDDVRHVLGLGGPISMQSFREALSEPLAPSQIALFVLKGKLENQSREGFFRSVHGSGSGRVVLLHWKHSLKNTFGMSASDAEELWHIMDKERRGYCTFADFLVALGDGRDEGMLLKEVERRIKIGFGSIEQAFTGSPPDNAMHAQDWAVQLRKFQITVSEAQQLFSLLQKHGGASIKDLAWALGAGQPGSTISATGFNDQGRSGDASSLFVSLRKVVLQRYNRVADAFTYMRMDSFLSIQQLFNALKPFGFGQDDCQNMFAFLDKRRDGRVLTGDFIGAIETNQGPPVVDLIKDFKSHVRSHWGEPIQRAARDSFLAISRSNANISFEDFKQEVCFNGRLSWTGDAARDVFDYIQHAYGDINMQSWQVFLEDQISLLKALAIRDHGSVDAFLNTMGFRDRRRELISQDDINKFAMLLDKTITPAERSDIWTQLQADINADGRLLLEDFAYRLGSQVPRASQTLLDRLRRFFQTRYNSPAAAMLTLDTNRSGRINFAQFSAAIQQLNWSSSEMEDVFAALRDQAGSITSDQLNLLWQSSDIFLGKKRLRDFATQWTSHYGSLDVCFREIKKSGSPNLNFSDWHLALLNLDRTLTIKECQELFQLLSPDGRNEVSIELFRLCASGGSSGVAPVNSQPAQTSTVIS